MRHLINAMVAVTITEVSEHEVVVSAIVELQPGILIAIGGVVNDRIVGCVWACYLNARRISLILLGIREGHIVADRHIGTTSCQPNAILTIVIRGIASDQRVGCAGEVNALSGGARGRAAGVADMVVLDGDVVRTVNVNPIIHRVGDREAVHHDVAFAGHPKGTTGCCTVSSHCHTRRRRVCDGVSYAAGIRPVHSFGVGTSQYPHGIPGELRCSRLCLSCRTALPA